MIESTIWVLILFAHINDNVSGKSNAITTAEFSSQGTCIKAGEAAKQLVKSAVKQIEFTCVRK